MADEIVKGVEADAEKVASDVATDVKDDAQVVEKVTVVEAEKIDGAVQDDSKTVLTDSESKLKEAWEAVHEIEQRIQHWVVDGWRDEVANRLFTAKAKIAEASPVAASAAQAAAAPVQK